MTECEPLEKSAHLWVMKVTFAESFKTDTSSDNEEDIKFKFRHFLERDSVDVSGDDESRSVESLNKALTFAHMGPLEDAKKSAREESSETINKRCEMRVPIVKQLARATMHISKQLFDAEVINFDALHLLHQAAEANFTCYPLGDYLVNP